MILDFIKSPSSSPNLSLCLLSASWGELPPLPQGLRVWSQLRRRGTKIVWQRVTTEAPQLEMVCLVPEVCKSLCQTRIFLPERLPKSLSSVFLNVCSLLAKAFHWSWSCLGAVHLHGWKTQCWSIIAKFSLFLGLFPFSNHCLSLHGPDWPISSTLSLVSTTDTWSLKSFFGCPWFIHQGLNLFFHYAISNHAVNFQGISKASITLDLQVSHNQYAMCAQASPLLAKHLPPTACKRAVPPGLGEEWAAPHSPHFSRQGKNIYIYKRRDIQNLALAVFLSRDFHWASLICDFYSLSHDICFDSFYPPLSLLYSPAHLLNVLLPLLTFQYIFYSE